MGWKSALLIGVLIVGCSDDSEVESTPPDETDQARGAMKELKEWGEEFAEHQRKIAAEEKEEKDKQEQIEKNAPHFTKGTTVDDIQISFSKPYIGKIEFREDSLYVAPKEDHLLIPVTLKNTSPTRIVTIQDPWGEVALKDEHKNYYKNVINFTSQREAKGIDQDRRLRPGESIRHLIGYEVPIDNAHEFLVIGDPGFFVAKGDSLLGAISRDQIALKLSRADFE